MMDNRSQGQGEDGTMDEFAFVGALSTRIKKNVEKVVVGKAPVIDLALTALLAGGHALIEDIPGTGKTTLAKTLAASIECAFQRLQFTPDMIPSDILGVNIYHQNEGRFEFQPGPIFTQILLADEINRTSPRTQAALLEAMQEEQVSTDGETRPLPHPFFCLATLNPIEMTGTFPLPEAQLDRFLLSFSMGYPSLDAELELLARQGHDQNDDKVTAVARAEEILRARTIVNNVSVSDPARRYIRDIAAATREDERLSLGASPRAALALQQACRAYAAINGRGFVIPDDIKLLAVACLAHRMIVDPAMSLRDVTAASVIAALLETIAVPIDASDKDREAEE